jgi:Na+/H+ antiporter NhaD/arsenite permease-like protein
MLGGILRDSPSAGLIILAWVAALLTCALNAGPTTALLVHTLLASVPPGAAGEQVWWALSLGVCAGSSGTLTGATAGPVAASLLAPKGAPLTFARFARTGTPLMLVFLLLSSGYLLFIAR